MKSHQLNIGALLVVVVIAAITLVSCAAETKGYRSARNPAVTNSIGMDFVMVYAGSFSMGEDEAPYGSNCPAHPVTITKRFYMGMYEVTNAQWRQVMGGDASFWKPDEHPCEVSWHDAVEFCRKLSALPEERKAGRVYRLPTEAEWEFTCRGGTTTLWSFGNDAEQFDHYGWLRRDFFDRPHPVGQKRYRTGFGCYDMHGNVDEWCSDWYGAYPVDAVTDPQGPSSGTHRVRRGGGSGLGITTSNCWSASRSSSLPDSKHTGFRLVLVEP